MRANASSVPKTHSACGWAKFLHGLTGSNIILYINGAPHVQPFLIHGLPKTKWWMVPSQVKIFNNIFHIKFSLCNYYKQKRKAGFIWWLQILVRSLWILKGDFYSLTICSTEPIFDLHIQQVLSCSFYLFNETTIIWCHYAGNGHFCTDSWRQSGVCDNHWCISRRSCQPRWDSPVTSWARNRFSGKVLPISYWSGGCLSKSQWTNWNLSLFALMDSPN